MDHNYTAYFRRLRERVDSAVAVPFREVRLGEWEPRVRECHDNVDFWVEHHPEARVRGVRGWLFRGANGAGQYLFMAHSVLDENGQLVDITPLDKNTLRDRLLLLRHIGTEDFSAMKTPCAQVLYPSLTFDEWKESQSSEVADGDGDY